MTQQQQQQNVQPLTTFKSFQAVHPPEFKGTLNPVEAKTWLIDIEKAFALVKVGEDQKTEFASYYLKAEANFWWESVKLGEGEITWQRFTELFQEKYLPRYLQDQLEVQFLELKQEGMSVAEYEAKFTELARFAPRYVGDDVSKARKFQHGLKPWLRSRVAAFELRNYTAVVQKAMIIEGESELVQKEKFGKKRKFRGSERSQGDEGQGSSQNRKRFGNQSGGDRSFQKQRSGFGSSDKKPQGGKPPTITGKPSIPECKTCGKRHSGICNKLNITCFKCNKKGHYADGCPSSKPGGLTCFKCGKAGHFARECKEPVQSANVLRLTAPPTRSQSSQPRARTFNMSINEAVQDRDVVAGTLPVNSVKAKVLIDSGATRSFISERFLDKLQCEIKPLERTLVIEVANQDRVPVDQVCPNCKIEIGGYLFHADLIPFKMGEFDVILGMDWLVDCDAQIECRKKQVRLRVDENQEVVFQGQRQTRKFLTFMQTTRLLRQGCEAYLAHVVDVEKQVLKMEEIPVVNEFPEVFPDELPGLPPDREVEFTIDLAPGTEPVSKAPYRMAPAEMKELATQLQDLLDKGVVRPSNRRGEHPYYLSKIKTGV